MANYETRHAQAEDLVKGYTLGALAVGLLPFPLIDMAVVMGLQLKMLHSLATVYEVEFSSQLGKSLIAALVGGGIPASVSSHVTRVAKMLPLGWVAGSLSGSLFNGASTYAVGEVFIQHFDSGGTFLTFDPQRVREYYAQQFEKGKEVIRTSFAGVKP